jgi:hypothetical protein
MPLQDILVSRLITAQFVLTPRAVPAQFILMSGPVRSAQFVLIAGLVWA